MYGSERLCFHLKRPLLAYTYQSKTKEILKQQDNIMGDIYFYFLILKNSKEKKKKYVSKNHRNRKTGVALTVSLLCCTEQ